MATRCRQRNGQLPALASSCDDHLYDSLPELGFGSSSGRVVSLAISRISTMCKELLGCKSFRLCTVGGSDLSSAVIGPIFYLN